MTAYYGGSKIKDTGAYGVYLGSQNTNCLTKTPKNINLEITYGAWTQPVLTADGTWGGDSFATKTKNGNSGAYKAFDSSSTSYIGLNTGADNELYFYNPQPLKISKIDFTYYPSTWIINGELYGSNDDSNYVKLATIAHSANTGSITVNNTTGYKYFKIKAISANGSDGFSKKITDFYHIAITATALNTLVLKKDSKVYVPNGKNSDGSYKFDEIVIGSDLSYTEKADIACLLYYSPNKKSILRRGAGPTGYSGLEANKVTNGAYYATDTNFLYSVTSSGEEKVSLPLAMITSTTAGGITSIDQVFDWCGYIGSTIFVVPNVEGLIPDGFNADGTYKSKKFKTTTVALAINPDKNDKLQYIHITDYGGIARDDIYHASETQPTFSENSNQLWYNPKTNLMYYYRTTSNNGFKSWTLSGITFKGSSDSRISEFNIRYTAQPAMTYMPINTIYNGSQKVYQYNSYQPSTVLVSQAGDNTSRTIKLRKGVYEIVVTGGGGFGKYGWYNAIFHGQGGSGSSIYGEIYVPEDTTITYYAGTDNQSASSSAYGYSSYIAVGGTQILTAGGGQSGWDFGNNGAGGTTTNNISASKFQNISLTFKNGVAGGSGGTSVDPDGISGEGGKATGTSSDRGNVGRVYIKYVRYEK